MPILSDKLAGSNVVLPYGMHITAGSTVAYARDTRSNRIKLISLLSEGVCDSQVVGGLEKAVTVYYAGEEIPEFDSNNQRNWKYHPGQLSAGFDDPVQGAPYFWQPPWDPTLQFTFSGSAYLELLLPEAFSEGEEEPTRLKVYYRTLQVPDYDQFGNWQGDSYSSNLARVALDLLLRRMGLPERRINWASWYEFRQRCGELIPWNPGPGGRTATVDVNGSVLTWKSGRRFESFWTGTVFVAGQGYQIQSVDSDTQITLTAAPPAAQDVNFRWGYVERFQANVAFSNVPAGEAFVYLMALAPGCTWQDVNGQIRFITTPVRRPVHHFRFDTESVNPSNIVADTVTFSRIRQEERPTLLRVKFRNLDDLYLAEKEISEIRDTGAGFERGVPEPLNWGVMTESQAQRALRTLMVENHDLDVLATLHGQGDSYRVARGDVVELSFESLGVRESAPLQMLVREETFQSTATGEDERVFKLQLYDPEFYSDELHGPVQPVIVTDLPPLASPGIAARTRARRAIDPTGRYRGRDTGVFDRARLVKVTYNDIQILENGLQMSFRLYGEIDNGDGRANADSLEAAWLKVYDKFGNLIYDNKYPFRGQGKLGGGVILRANADPREEAVFEIRLMNAFGWSQPRFITWRPWSGVAGELLNNLPSFLNPDDCPQNLKAVPVSDKQVRLTWTPARNGGANQAAFIKYPLLGYEGWTWLTPPVAPYVPALSPAENTLLVGVEAPLQPDSIYDFAIWRSANGEFRSNIAFVRTLNQPIVVDTQRSAPGSLAAVPLDSTHVKLTWTRNAGDNDAVEVEEDGAVVTTLTPGSTTEYTRAVAAGSTHTWRVRNKWMSGVTYSEWSNAAQATTPAGTAGDPSQLSAHATGARAVALAWNNNGNTGAVTLKWREAGLTAWNTQLLAGGTTSYTKSGLQPETEYEFQIEITGAAQPSNIAYAITDPIIRDDPYGGGSVL
jgi:hypothetical protein